MKNAQIKGIPTANITIPNTALLSHTLLSFKAKINNPMSDNPKEYGVKLFTKFLNPSDSYRLLGLNGKANSTQKNNPKLIVNIIESKAYKIFFILNSISPLSGTQTKLRPLRRTLVRGQQYFYWWSERTIYLPPQDEVRGQQVNCTLTKLIY